jgi:DNA-binding SARP family transcriptional activator
MPGTAHAPGPASSLRVGLLGATRLITPSGEVCVIGSPRQRTVLAVLALHAGRTVTTEELIDEMWRDDVPQKARNALQATIARLRRSIRLDSAADRSGREVLVASGAGYLLMLEAGDVDALRFQQLAQDGIRLVPSSPGKAVPILRQALAMWYGEALADAGNGPRCVAAATHVEELRIAAEGQLMAAYIGNGEYGRAVAPLRELLAEHPEREDICRLLITALRTSGRQAEAVTAYHRTRTWLARELGLMPSQSLEAAYLSALHEP